MLDTYYQIYNIFLDKEKELANLLEEIKKNDIFDKNIPQYSSAYTNIILSLSKELESHIFSISEFSYQSNINIPIYLLSNVYWVVEIDSNKNELYFEKMPNKVPYAKNIKTTINKTNKYVWKYYINDKVTSNYDSSDSPDSKGYDNMLNNRLVLKVQNNLNKTKTILSPNKYKFDFEISKTINLPDPKHFSKINNSSKISPKKQGIIDGYYTLGENLEYDLIGECVVTIENTCNIILVLLNDIQKYILYVTTLLQQIK